MIFTTVKRIALCSFLFASSTALMGQDLLAHQAPIDRKQKASDSLSIAKLIDQEALENPSSELYSTWNNKSVFCYSSKDVPETYKIDCRNFAMPTPSRLITSRVGYRPKFRRMHKGLDIKVYTGDTIYAAFDGRIRMTAYQPTGYGNVVVIRHNNGLETIYGHLSKHLVKEGQVVRAGQPIGLGGNTGRSFGSHLHFETRLVGALIDPEEIFDFANQDVKCDFYVFRKDGASKAIARSNGGSELTAKNVENASGSQRKDNVESQLQGKFHKVSAGENVASIARRLDISVETLCSANHISRSTHLRPGQILRY